jgi:hypothetical protein
VLEHWLIEPIRHVSGLSDAQLKQIEKSLPATKALVDLLNRARPQAKREWQTVGPTAQILIDVISHLGDFEAELR